MSNKPRFDFWVCEGRLCTSRHSDRLKDVADAYLADDATDPNDAARTRVLRGGCYGLCELGPNVIVRRYETEADRPPAEEDRLSVTGEPNETAYSGIGERGLVRLIRRHLDRDEPTPELTSLSRANKTRETRELPSGVEARLRRLHQD